MTSLGDQLRRAVANGFEAQAAEYGRQLQSQAMEQRARNPLAIFLLDTFTRQIRNYAERAIAARDAGDRRRALELAKACENAGANKCRIEAAIRGEDEEAAASATGIPNWQGRAAKR